MTDVTTEDASTFVPVEERIAVFDNDGTPILTRQPKIAFVGDDAEREFAYDRQSKVGKHDKAWDEANAKGWIVVSTKRDRKHVFALQ